MSQLQSQHTPVLTTAARDPRLLKNVIDRLHADHAVKGPFGGFFMDLLAKLMPTLIQIILDEIQKLYPPTPAPVPAPPPVPGPS